MKSRPYRLKLRPARRPPVLKFDLNLKPDLSIWSVWKVPPAGPPAWLTAAPRPITAADVEQLAAACRPAADCFRRMGAALSLAAASPGLGRLLEQAREAQERRARHERLLDLERQALADVGRRVDFRIRAADLVLPPGPLVAWVP